MDFRYVASIVMVKWTSSINTSVSSEMTLMLVSFVELSTMDNIWWIMMTSASSWALHKSSRRMDTPWLILAGIRSHPVTTSLWLVDDSCCFYASRVSTMTSTSCIVLYVTASTTFWGGRCIDSDSWWCMLACFPHAVRVTPLMLYSSHLSNIKYTLASFIMPIT